MAGGGGFKAAILLIILAASSLKKVRLTNLYEYHDTSWAGAWENAKLVEQGNQAAVDQTNITSSSSDYVAPEQVVVENDDGRRHKNNNNNHCFFFITNLWGNMSDSRHLATLHFYQDTTVQSVLMSVEALKRELRREDFYYDIILRAKDRFLNEPLDPSAIEFPQRQVVTLLNWFEDGTYMQRKVQENQCNHVTVMRIDADDAISPGYLNDIWKSYYGNGNNNCNYDNKNIKNNNQNNKNATDGGESGDNNDTCIVLTGAKEFYRLLAFQGRRDDHVKGITYPRIQDYNKINRTNFHCSIKLENRQFLLSTGLALSTPTSIWLKLGGNSLHDNVFYRHTKIQTILKRQLDRIRKRTKDRINLVISTPTDLSILPIWTSTQLSGHFTAYKGTDEQPCNLTRDVMKVIVAEHNNNNNINNTKPGEDSEKNRSSYDDYYRTAQAELLERIVYRAPSLSKLEQYENAFLTRNQNKK